MNSIAGDSHTITVDQVRGGITGSCPFCGSAAASMSYTAEVGEPVETVVRCARGHVYRYVTDWPRSPRAER